MRLKVMLKLHIQALTENAPPFHELQHRQIELQKINKWAKLQLTAVGVLSRSDHFSSKVGAN